MTTTPSTKSSSGKAHTTLLVIITAILTVVVVAMLVNIFERKQEAKNTFVRVVDVTDDTDDPAVWGKNFPAEYDTYKKTTEMTPTLYGGSKQTPHVPTATDPRTMTSHRTRSSSPTSTARC